MWSISSPCSVLAPDIAAETGSHVSDTILPGLERRLKSQLTGEVRFDAFTRGRYATDASHYRIMPLGVFAPRTMEEAADGLPRCGNLIIRIQENSHRRSICHSFVWFNDRCSAIAYCSVWGSCIMPKPAVVLIGADKGGVGKTTVARTLLDYFGANQVRVRAFDTEVPRGTLKRFYPEVTEVVDINHVPDQMKIFDTLNIAGASVTLIDVRAGLMLPTLRALRDIGFIDAAKQGELTLAVFHILGPSIASLDEIGETAGYLGDAKYIMVKNFINNTHFFEWDEATHRAYFRRIKDAVEITIPKLSEMAMEQVELASVPFASFSANKKQKGEPAAYSFVLRGYVRHWLGNVSAEYDRIGVLDIVRPREPAPAVDAVKLRPVMRIAEAAS